ncbi:MAG: TolC family protein [Gammaproteobacteria bacterium]|nr:TolC family protein [Gammaproteobacteria bacterium]
MFLQFIHRARWCAMLAAGLIGTGAHAQGAPPARQDQPPLTLSEALRRAEAQLFELHQELKHAITETALLRDTVLPEMNDVLTQTRYAYERGRYGYLEWVAAQREFIDVQRSLIEAAANAHNYRTEIERLTAEPLADSN